MRTCPKCGTKNPADRDFCGCGEYLRWEPTGYMPVVTPPPAPAENPSEEAAAAATTTPPPPEPPPTAVVSPPPPAPPTREPATRSQTAAPAPAASAAITLRLPQEEAGAGGGTLGLAIVPGERARVLALVRNQGSIVDNYNLVVHGLPREWWTVSPETVYLVPFGSAGAYEQEIEIVLHPPRTPEAEARRWELHVGVYSRARRDEVAAARFTLGILPFEQYAVRVRPERASGRLRAKYDVRLANDANAVVKLAIDAVDSDGECRFRFDTQAVDVPAGSTRTVRLRVEPPRQIWLGRAIDRRFEIVAGGGEAGEQLLADKLQDGAGRDGKLPKIPGVTPPKVGAPKLSVGPGGVNVKGPQVRGPNVRVPKAKAINLSRPTLGLRALKQPDRGAAPAAPAPPLLPTQAIFRQKAWLPWWLAIAVPLLALLGLMLFLLLPKHVSVPDVVGSKGVFAAQEKLTQAGLVLGSREETPSTKAEPGTILAQSPAAGTDAEKDSAVSIEIAVSNGETKVPKLTGLTLVDAERKLRGASLTKGAISVNPPDLKAKIASTLPGAGESVKVGSPVDIFYADPKAKDKGGAAGAAGGAAGGAGGGAAGGGDAGATAGDIAVPKIEPADIQGYGTALTKAKLVPGSTEKQISDAKAGTVFGTDPPVGTKVAAGTKVTLLVSVGFPLMAFDTNGNVVRANAADGTRVTPAIAKTPAEEKDATWSADGKNVVFTVGGKLAMADAAKPGRTPVALRPAAETWADPSFAPTTGKRVLAAARVNGGDRQNTDLCVGKVTIDEYTPQCMEDDRFAVTFAQWSHDGRTILVGTVSPKGFGVVRYHSKVPFSTQKRDWGRGVVVTPRTPASGVRDEAISPDGKQLAAIANLDGGAFVLYLGKPGDLKLEKAARLEVQGCKVLWLDSRWLAVVQLGSACEQDTGPIVRLAADKPTEITPITTDGDNPTFRPFSAGG
jgi:beta-lactam-binding protein with PASTA domain